MNAVAIIENCLYEVAAGDFDRDLNYLVELTLIVPQLSPFYEESKRRLIERREDTIIEFNGTRYAAMCISWVPKPLDITALVTWRLLRLVDEAIERSELATRDPAG